MMKRLRYHLQYVRYDFDSVPMHILVKPRKTVSCDSFQFRSVDGVTPDRDNIISVILILNYKLDIFNTKPAQ